MRHSEIRGVRETLHTVNTGIYAGCPSIKAACQTQMLFGTSVFIIFPNEIFQCHSH